MKFTATYGGIELVSAESIEVLYSKTSTSIIWRLSNQSLYADLLKSLQSSFLRPDLCISVVSTESSFHLDLDNDRLIAQSSFRLMTVSDVPSAAARTGAGAAEPGRLVLASVRGDVVVDLRQRTIKQFLHSPSLCMVFETDLRLSHLCFARLDSTCVVCDLICPCYTPLPLLLPLPSLKAFRSRRAAALAIAHQQRALAFEEQCDGDVDNLGSPRSPLGPLPLPLVNSEKIKGKKPHHPSSQRHASP